MLSEPAPLADVLLLEPAVQRDERGFFMESYNRARFAEMSGRDLDFVQDNHSLSRRGVLRGLHYQLPPHPQAKLVRVVRGEIFDVAVDIRRRSPTFGRWRGATLSGANRCQMWVPEGFAHGFLTLSEEAEVIYKTSDYYARDCERAIAWDDPAIGIEWPLSGAPILSDKDSAAPRLAQADVFE